MTDLPPDEPLSTTGTQRVADNRRDIDTGGGMYVEGDVVNTYNGVVTTGDLLQRLNRISETYRDWLRTQAGADDGTTLRELERSTALFDGSATEDDGINDLRRLMCSGITTTLRGAMQNPRLQDAASAACPIVAAALWAVVVAPVSARPAMMFEAMSALTTHTVNILVQDLIRANPTASSPSNLHLRFAQRLARSDCRAGVAQVLQDLDDQERGGPFLHAALGAAQPMQFPQHSARPEPLHHLMLFMLGAGAGAVGATVSAAAMADGAHLFADLRQWLRSTLDSPARTELESRPEMREAFAPQRWMLGDIDMCRIPSGAFLMGSDQRVDKQAYDNEQPQHRVFVSEFSIGRISRPRSVTPAHFGGKGRGWG